MTAADERVAELLQRWLASVELHTHYLDLDDAAYARVQDWPRHQRPTRWVLDLARNRVTELQRHLAERHSRGDSEFAVALELMGLLTTLLGSEHIERFVPQAVPRRPDPLPPPPDEAPVSATQPEQKVAGAAAAPRRVPPKGPATTKPVVSASTPLRRKATRRQKQGLTSGRPAPEREAEPAATIPDKVTATVIADAVRFLTWGREWPQLASSIARLADRPPEQEVWKILRQHRGAIEAKAHHKPD